jgi:regulator of replication initiation timing
MIDNNRRFDDVFCAIRDMSKRIAALENGRDEKSGPYDVMDSFRSSKIERDAGEPPNRHYIDCLQENARLVEENDVLKYQYEAMHKEAVRCKDQIEKLQLENRDLRWRFDNQPLVEKQTARACTEIVTKIKNDPLTVGEGKRWMVAVCEDIEREIKKDFDLR